MVDILDKLVKDNEVYFYLNCRYKSNRGKALLRFIKFNRWIDKIKVLPFFDIDVNGC